MPVVPDAPPAPSSVTSPPAALPRRLAPWVSDTEMTDDPDLLNIALPTGVTLAALCDAATDYLWRASGARYDAYQVTVRPSRLTAACVDSGPSLGLHGQGDGYVSEVRLEGPASDITVTVDGEALGADEWTLFDGYRLLRVGGLWRCCQDLTLADGALGTWSVRYTSGPPTPPLGRLAARELTKQLALYHSGRPSKLPAGTTSVTRAGISVNIDRPKRSSGGDPGTSGLPTVELFLDASNPNRLRRAPLVLSPDVQVGGRTS